MRYQLFLASREHRGLRRYLWSWRESCQLLLLLFASMAVAITLQPHVAGWWAEILGKFWPSLGLGDGEQIYTQVREFGGYPWQQVKIDLQVQLPNLYMWWGTLALTVGLWVVSMLMSREYMPFIYLMRFVAILLGAGLLANEIWTANMNTDAGKLLEDVLQLGQFLLLFIPLVHALVLYIFPLYWSAKLLATLCSLAFVILSVPLQVGALAIIANATGTLSFIPLYMLGTYLPQLVVQLAIYGYFMSWAKPPEVL